MPTEFQFDFSPEVQALREPVLAAIRRATAERTLSNVQEAQRLSAEWLASHPKDYAILDAGEALVMLEEAVLRTEQVLTLTSAR